jgi:hypothetical protein
LATITATTQGTTPLHPPSSPHHLWQGRPQQPGASRILRALVHGLGQAVPTRRNLRRISRTGVCDGKPPGPAYPSPIRNVANRCKVAESPRSRAKIAPPLPIRKEAIRWKIAVAGTGFAKLNPALPIRNVASWCKIPPAHESAAALGRTSIFASQTAHLVPNARRATKSGGRKPPVQGTPHASSTRQNSPRCRCNRGFRPAAG